MNMCQRHDHLMLRADAITASSVTGVAPHISPAVVSPQARTPYFSDGVPRGLKRKVAK